jgi:hypothetical protein
MADSRSREVASPVLDSSYPKGATMTQQDFESIVQTLDRLAAGEELVLIEHFARSLRAHTDGEQVSAAEQREAMRRLRREVKALPILNPSDGFPIATTTASFMLAGDSRRRWLSRNTLNVPTSYLHPPLTG